MLKILHITGWYPLTVPDTLHNRTPCSTRYTPVPTFVNNLHSIAQMFSRVVIAGDKEKKTMIDKDFETEDLYSWGSWLFRKGEGVKYVLLLLWNLRTSPLEYRSVNYLALDEIFPSLSSAANFRQDKVFQPERMELEKLQCKLQSLSTQHKVKFLF